MAILPPRPLYTFMRGAMRNVFGSHSTV